jgi:hypothetical protein
MTPDTPAGHGVAAGDLVLAQDLQEVQVAEVPGVGLGEPGSTGSGTCDQARLAVTQDAIAHSRRVVLARAPKVLAKHPMPAVRSLAAFPPRPESRGLHAAILMNQPKAAGHGSSIVGPVHRAIVSPMNAPDTGSGVGHADDPTWSLPRSRTRRTGAR